MFIALMILTAIIYFAGVLFDLNALRFGALVPLIIGFVINWSEVSSKLDNSGFAIIIAVIALIVALDNRKLIR